MNSVLNASFVFTQHLQLEGWYQNGLGGDAAVALDFPQLSALTEEKFINCYGGANENLPQQNDINFSPPKHEHCNITVVSYCPRYKITSTKLQTNFIPKVYRCLHDISGN